MPVQFGIEIVTLGELSDPAVVVDLARAAEAAGWDGVFVWDHLAGPARP
jgi:alkanesulfonate monooxygenase SsuD/methylene tetrahydromethanopterin reductase-like flavin-dependent oxidoreductase (luciferase family)